MPSVLQGRRGIKHGSKNVRVTTERRFSFNLPRKRSMFKPHLKSNPATGKVGRGSGLGLNQQIAGRWSSANHRLTGACGRGRGCNSDVAAHGRGVSGLLDTADKHVVALNNCRDDCHQQIAVLVGLAIVHTVNQPKASADSGVAQLRHQGADVNCTGQRPQALAFKAARLHGRSRKLDTNLVACQYCQVAEPAVVRITGQRGQLFILGFDGLQNRFALRRIAVSQVQVTGQTRQGMRGQTKTPAAMMEGFVLSTLP